MMNPHAFPSPGVIFTEPNTKHQHQQGAYEGMSLRDYFAAKAMVGMLAYAGDSLRGSHHTNNTPEGVAQMAYGYADAMLAERAK